MITELYRYHDYGDEDFTNLKVDVTIYPVFKETKKGYWIYQKSLIKKWVTKDNLHKFAYATKEEAMINFLGRKHKQIRFLKAQLSQAKLARRIIQEMIRDNNITLPHKT